MPEARSIIGKSYMDKNTLIIHHDYGIGHAKVQQAKTKLV
jgi:hypothetical protein